MNRLLFVLCLTALLSSCSHAFNREWKTALKAGPQAGMEGAWAGTWTSDVNGHHGRLRCVVGPVKNKEGDHSFHYHATWGSILSGAYRADHRVTGAKGEWRFEGRHQMPDWAGGLYTYRGTVKGDDFNAGYDCERDKGAFRMTRVR